ncbi:MAG: zinc-ribbon domain-containing protein [Planctomycetes bacterium]|nr:zinc-ribbon domain-containing protein [Planctomycetota bacterium]
MLIACPFCKTQAKIAEELEGSKVKCPQCKRTYSALEKLERGDKVLTPGRLLLASLVVPIVGGTILYVVKSTESAPTIENRTDAMKEAAAAPVAAAASVAAPAVAAPVAPESKWNTDALDAVRELFGAAYAFDAARASTGLAEVAGAPTAKERAKQIVQDESYFAFAKWKPGQLRIVRQDDASSKVHGNFSARDASAAACEYDFELAKDGGRWKVASWTRTKGQEPGTAVDVEPGTKLPNDAKALAANALKANVEPRHLEHFATTDAALRTKIDGLFERMLDFKLSPTENTRASNELAEIGKPALPVLINGIYDQRIVDVESTSKVILINQTLQRITDHTTVFAPGPDLAKVEELRQRTVKSWFEWWGYSGERFNNKPTVLDEFDVEPAPKTKKR